MRGVGLLAALGAVIGLSVGLAFAQTPPPQGTLVFNQAKQARLLTKSDTTSIPATRALWVGDAAACSITVRFAGDTANVTIANVQVGQILPFSIIRLASATTCTAITALW